MIPERNILLEDVNVCFVEKSDPRAYATSIMVTDNCCYRFNKICFGSLKFFDKRSYISNSEFQSRAYSERFKEYSKESTLQGVNISNVFIQIKKANCSEEFKNKFLDWLTYESPYQEAFIKDDMEFMRANNFLELDVSKNHSYMAGAAILSRFVTEPPNYYKKAGEVDIMEKLVSLGCPMISSYILSTMYKSCVGPNSKITLTPSYLCETCPIYPEKNILKNFFNNKHSSLEEFRFKNTKTYSSVQRFWSDCYKSFPIILDHNVDYVNFFQYETGSSVTKDLDIFSSEKYKEYSTDMTFSDDELKDFHDFFVETVLKG